MSDRDENLREYLVLLRRFGLSKRELADLHWPESSDPPEVSPERLVAHVVDDESRTVDALYSRLHGRLAASSIGMDVPSDADANAFEEGLSTVFASHDVSLHVEPVGVSALEDVVEGDPIEICLTDRHGNSRSTTDTYPAPDDLPELVGVIESELLADVEVRFVLLDPDETRWRFLLLSEPRLDALQEAYGERIEFEGRPLLDDRQPADVVSATRTDVGRGESTRSDEPVPHTPPDRNEASGGEVETVGTGTEEPAASADEETDWFDDDVDLEDVGFEPATAQTSQSDPDESVEDVDTEGMDSVFAEIESEAADVDWDAPAGDSGSMDDVEDVEDILESAEESEPSAAEPEPSIRPGPDPDPAVSPVGTRPGTDPTPAVRSIGTVPADEPVPATVETPPDGGPSETPSSATDRIRVTPGADPAPAVEVAAEPATDADEGAPTVAPASAPRAAVHELSVTPGPDPSPAVHEREMDADVAGGPTPATTAVDVTPGTDVEPAVGALGTAPSSDPTPAVRPLAEVPGEDPAAAIVPRVETPTAVMPADAPVPATSSIAVRPSDATTPAADRIGVTPGASPEPAVRERDESPAVEPADDPTPAIRRAPEATTAPPSSSPDQATGEGGTTAAVTPGPDPRPAVRTIDDEPKHESDAEAAPVETESAPEAEPAITPGDATTSAVDRITVVPGENPDPAVQRAPFEDRVDGTRSDEPGSDSPEETEESRGALDRIKGWLGGGS